MNWNWGRIFVWAGMVLNFGACIGYVANEEYNNALYWLLVALIGAVMLWRK